jgi:NodT family efflux transporter outer membrane factor (OMF) lipoprotein
VLAALLAASLLAGCASINPVATARPELATPMAWREAPSGIGFPEAEWWRGFQSPDLVTLVQQARAGNQDLEAAVQRMAQADALVRVAGSPLLPSLDATADAAVSERNGANTRRIYGGGLSSRWEVDLWGRNRDALAAEKARALSDRFDRDALALSLDAGVADTYLLLVAARERRRIAAANLEAAERVLALVAVRVANGAASPLELAQQRAAVARQRATLPPLDLATRQAEHALAVLLSRAPGSLAPNSDRLEALSAPTVPAGLPSELLLRRPDLARAEANLAAAAGDVSVARKALYPSITLTVFGGAESPNLASLLNGNWLTSAATGLTAPIFSGGFLRGRLAFAEARQKELVALYRAAAYGAFADVEDALAATQARTLELSLSEQAAEAARTAATLAEAQYREGAIDLLALLVSQRAAFDAEDALAVARRERLRAAVALFRALGGGWRAPGAA